MVSFQNINYLYFLTGLIPLVLLFLWVLKWKVKARRQLGDEELINNITDGYSKRNFNWKFILMLLALVCCIVGAANLRRPVQGNTGDRTGIDVMVALDVSNSMLAQDIKPSRLERAKQVVQKLVEKLGNNRLGLVVFAGQAFLQMPLTSDLAAASMYVSNAGPDAVPNQGTVIADALNLCNASLDNKEKKYKAVILITDGEDHNENAIKAAKELSQSGVLVFTVGIGSTQGAPIFDTTLNDFKKDENGVTILSKLNEKELMTIAKITGGQYQYFTNSGTVANKIASLLDGMEKKRIGGSGIKMYDSYFQWFLLAAFILLLLEIVIPERKMKWFLWSK